MHTDTYDAVVVGGSWAGLSAAMQLARARRRVLVVDAGRPRNRFAHSSHGFLGQDGRAPMEILDTARSQVLAYPTAEFRSDEVIRADPCDAASHAEDVKNRTFEIVLASGAVARSRRLVLATGVVDELPDVPGLRERWGVTVLHCPYCHGYEVAGGRLGVLAIGEMSVHQALLLPDWSSDVTFFINGTFEPTDEHRAHLAARGVQVESRSVAGVVGDPDAALDIQLDGPEGREVVRLDALFTGPRTRMASPLAGQLGCLFDDAPHGPVIQTDATKATTVPGVFAAGDAARAQHNATWASADGVMAGMAAHRSLALP